MAGVMNERTIKVSKSRPSPMVVPTWAMTRRSLIANDIIVKANTRPAEVTTLPVPPIDRMMPVFNPAARSSRKRDTRSRL
jgi:hypothetical protein